MEVTYISDLPEREIVPGYHGHFVHSANMTLAWWDVEAGATLPLHQHPHEQVTSVIEGEFELTVDGQTMHCLPGAVVVIPGGVVHSARALTVCRLFDAFYPVRQEYR